MREHLRVLRHRQFRYLFLGQSLSVLGDRLVVVALALYITRRTGSAVALGVVLLASSLPLVALLALGGVVADRLPRQRIMLSTDLARAVLHGLLAALILTGAPAVWLLAAVEACFGAARAFFQPAYAGLLPQTVPEGRIREAQALSATSQNLAFLLGPALGTALVLGIGSGEAFALDAASFLASAALLAQIRPRPRGEAQAPGPLLQALREGLGEVRARPWVWATIAVFTGAVLCVFAPWYALAPLLARRHYGGAAFFGVLESLEGAGALLGALVALRLRPARPLRAGLIMILLWPAQSLAYALLAPQGLLEALAVGTGLSFSLFGVWWETALAEHIPPRALSRVSAWDWMGSLALLPLGYLLAPALAGVAGLRTVMGAGASVGLVLLACGLIPRATRRLALGAGPGVGSGSGLGLDEGPCVSSGSGEGSGVGSGSGSGLGLDEGPCVSSGSGEGSGVGADLGAGGGADAEQPPAAERHASTLPTTAA